jgi:putative aldouronate transport system substrate-binding protein
MKHSKFLPLALASVMMFGALSACGGGSDQPDTPGGTQAPIVTPAPPTSTPEPTRLDELGLDSNLRFKTTRNITVEIYDRSNDGGTPPDDNVFTDFIKQGILAKHNINVTFVRVPRWTEGQDIANLMAAGTAPDVCVTYSYPTIQTYAGMGGVIDLYPILSSEGDGNLFPNIYDLLGTINIFWNLYPSTNKLWAIEAYLVDNYPTTVFVREDWLKTLGIAEPTTLQQFEDMLVAFRDNAERLLGPDASQMIPLGQSHDVRWGMRPVLDGFMPDNLTDKDRYVYGALESLPAHPAAKQTIQVYNKWYNMGLMWNDFSLYNDATLGSVLSDKVKAGYVGAFVGSYDEAYRNGDDSYQNNIKRSVGPEASFTTINSFPNNAGKYGRLTSAPVDRKVFFPYTNKEPIASMLYVDFISSFEVRKYLQIGEEGINHTVEPNGAIRAIGRPAGDPYIMNSSTNIDYTITINGLDLGDPDLYAFSKALGYPGTDPSLIQKSLAIGTYDRRIGKAVNVGVITSEEGMVDELNTKRNNMYITAITASPANFESVWSAGMADLLQSGLQAIMDERSLKWDRTYGAGTTMLPD